MSRLNPNGSFALLRLLNIDGSQWETRLEQLSSYKNQSLGYFYDSYPGYNQPKRVGSNVHFIYLGLLPVSMARNNNTQGYRANGKDFAFQNCDRKPNSYFAFYFNLHSDPYPGCMQNNFTTGWKDTSVKLQKTHYMPGYYYFPFLMHMGGCGGLGSPRQSFNDSLAAVGIPFNIPIPATSQHVRPSTKQSTKPVASSQFSVLTTIQPITSNHVRTSQLTLFPPTIQPVTSNLVTTSRSSVFSTIQPITPKHVTTSLPSVFSAIQPVTSKHVTTSRPTVFSAIQPVTSNHMTTSQSSVLPTIQPVSSNLVTTSRSSVFSTIQPIISNLVTTGRSSVFSTIQSVTSNIVTTSQWNPSKRCLCSCANISQFKGKHLTKEHLKEELKQELQKLRDSIKIQKNSTSAAIRSLISINNDKRTSSTGIGVSAIILIVLPFILIVAADCSKIMYRK
ncbi:uncharacterized protein LOC143062460 [Mytilus galloprovincialis]|uniref:uncharacterized protein LOC143062460 n=1 Tax=Mytilus galloprovincialis TaxID=29158 RepID=UPI003F7CA636